MGSTTAANQMIDCPCCMGAGYQYNRQTSINEPCRCCNGTGIKQNPIKITVGETWDKSKTGDTEIKG